MKISFVIPAYNEEALIAKCLQSVQEEIARNSYETEVIVVNNASTDKTREVAQSFKGIHIVDEPNKGLVFARRAGFLASTGELVANLDADVLVPEGWLGTVMEEFEQNQGLVGLSGPYIYYDVSPLQRVVVKVFYGFGYLVYLFNNHMLHRGSMLQGGNFVIRKDVWEAAGGYDTSIEFYGEETDVAYRLSKLGKVLWTWRLPMYTSGRRFFGEGMLKTGLLYVLNFVWVSVTGKPFTYEHTDIREK